MRRSGRTPKKLARFDPQPESFREQQARQLASHPDDQEREEEAERQETLEKDDDEVTMPTGKWAKLSRHKSYPALYLRRGSPSPPRVQTGSGTVRAEQHQESSWLAAALVAVAAAGLLVVAAHLGLNPLAVVHRQLNLLQEAMEHSKPHVS